MKKPGLNFNPGLVLIRLQTTKPWALKTGRQFVSRPKKKNKNIADELKLKLLDLSLDKLTNEVIFKNEKVQLRQSWFQMTVTFFCVKWCFVCLFVCVECEAHQCGTQSILLWVVPWLQHTTAKVSVVFKQNVWLITVQWTKKIRFSGH